MPTHIVVEGDVDRTIIEHFELVLPPNLLPTRGNSHQGRDKAIETAATLCFTLPTDKTVVLLLDLNGHGIGELESEIHSVCRRVWNHPGQPSGNYLSFGNGRIRFASAGLPESPEIKSLGFSRFTMDDYLVALLHDEESFEAFVAGETRSPWLQVESTKKTHAELLALMKKIIGVAHDAGVKIDTSKRWMDVFRAVVGFQASRATLAKHLLDRSPPRFVKKVFGGLCTALSTD